MAVLPVVLADNVRTAVAGEDGDFRLGGRRPLVDKVFLELAAAAWFR